MTWQIWLVFLTTSAILLALPRRSMIDVASFAIGLGRRSAFATVTGVIIGHLCAAALVFALAVTLALASPFALSLFQGAGLGLLAIKAISFWRHPTATEPVADNDNLPIEKPLGVVAHLVKRTTIQPDSLILFAAFLPQFATLAVANPNNAFALIGAFAGVAGLVAIAYALAAFRIRKFLQKHRRRRASDRARGTVLIAARTVTAGYRKIAA